MKLEAEIKLLTKVISLRLELLELFKKIESVGLSKLYSSLTFIGKECVRLRQNEMLHEKEILSLKVNEIFAKNLACPIFKEKPPSFSEKLLYILGKNVANEERLKLCNEEYNNIFKTLRILAHLINIHKRISLIMDDYTSKLKGVNKDELQAKCIETTDIIDGMRLDILQKSKNLVDELAEIKTLLDEGKQVEKILSNMKMKAIIIKSSLSEIIKFYCYKICLAKKSNKSLPLNEPMLLKLKAMFYLITPLTEKEVKESFNSHSKGSCFEQVILFLKEDLNLFATTILKDLHLFPMVVELSVFKHQKEYESLLENPTRLFVTKKVSLSIGTQKFNCLRLPSLMEVFHGRNVLR